LPAWNGREIDLHFVHLPEPVLFENDLCVSRRLIGIRERIAAGAMTRRMSQGQPYWIHEPIDAQP
jgi:hypothetical protein